MLSSRPVEIAANHPLQYAKTPGRMKNRGENAVRAPMTGKGARGKEVLHQTPHAAQIAGKLLSMTTRGKPLGDKTPFPNRVAGQNYETPGMGKIQKPSFELVKTGKPETMVESTQVRPSSLRKHARPPSGGKSFETPANKGNHWECEEASFTVQQPEILEVAPEDDFEEIEYMAPNTLNLPYQPPFDFELPDFKELGRTLYSLAHLRPYPDEPPAEISIDEEHIPTSWNFLELPELESDDPFRIRESPGRETLEPARTARATISKPESTTMVTSSRRPATTTRNTSIIPTGPKPVARAGIRSTTQASAAIGKPASSSRTVVPKTTSIPNRPATAAAIRPPSVSRVPVAAAAAIRRPTTSAANYKPTTLPSRRVPQKASSASASTTAGSISRKQPDAARRVDAGLAALVVNCAEVEVDEFTFDI